MDAIIHRVEGSAGAGLLDLAGQPLLVRQLQWLRALGVERVAVEVSGDPSSLALSRCLADHQALAHGVIEVISSRPLGAPEVARRAGLSSAPLVLVLGADVLGSGDLLRVLSRASGSVRLTLAPPPAAPSSVLGAEVAFVRHGATPEETIGGPGWGMRIRHGADALAITSLALRGALPCAGPEHAQGIQVHATESEPGVWLGRGVLIEPGARLEAPVLLGADVIVREGAVVGGGSVIGARAAIERGARVVTSLVAPDTVVGENVRLERAIARSGQLIDLGTGATLAQLDPLLIGSSTRTPARPLSSRVVALLGLLLAPLFVPLVALSHRDGSARAAALVRRLVSVLLGQASLLGFAEPVAAGDAPDPLKAAAARAPLGLVNVEPWLLPTGSTATDALRARAWYAETKSLRLDAGLLWRWLGASLRESESEPVETGLRACQLPPPL